MIRINNLQKQFNNVNAVDIKELSIDKGEIIGLLGNNGAGKTTLLRLILDLYQAEVGTVLSKNINVFQSEHWKKYTGSYLDSSFLIDFLTPEEFFYFSGSLYGLSKNIIDKRLTSYEHFMNEEILGKMKYIRNLSSGNKQKVGIISNLIIEPEVLILDEPFNFLDPTSQILLVQLLLELNKKKSTTLIISSHNLNQITELSSRIILMEKGVIVKDILSLENAIVELEAYFSKQL